MNNKLQEGKIKRKSNLELYRIFLMIGIILHHYVLNSGVFSAVTSENALRINSVIACLLGGWGKIGINGFLLITGYFMCNKNPKLEQWVRILFEIEFYNIIIYLLFCVLDIQIFSIKDFIKNTIPFYYVGTGFYSSYLVFWWFIPFLNQLIKNLNQKQFDRLLLILFIFESIAQTFLVIPNAFTYVGLFMFIYLIGAYIRYCDDGLFASKYNVFKRKKYIKITAMMSIIICCMSIIMGLVVYKCTGLEMVYHFVSDSNKLLAIITSIATFQMFKNIELGYCRVINTFGKSTFGVLMIHANSDTMRKVLWGKILDNVYYFNQNTSTFFFHIIFSCIGVYIICSVIDILRIVIIERFAFEFFKRFDRIKRILELEV